MSRARAASQLFCWFAWSGENIDPAALGWIFFWVLSCSSGLIAAIWSKADQPFSQRKHTWCGFVSYKGWHSLLLNCFGDSIISNSPPIQYLCLVCRSHWGANETTEYFKQLLSYRNSPSAAVLVACHFKKEDIDPSPVWGRGGASCLSPAHHLQKTGPYFLSLSGQGVHFPQGKTSNI